MSMEEYEIEWNFYTLLTDFDEKIDGKYYAVMAHGVDCRSWVGSRCVIKRRLYMKPLYAICATTLWLGKGYVPPHSHTTIRCVCNDIMDSWKKMGYVVCEWYSQDKAYQEVTKLIKQLNDEAEKIKIKPKQEG